jgi:hypothetical protein
MNWNTGFSALYDLKKVDPATWMDVGSFDFVSGTIDRTGTGLMESADLTMTEDPGECWVRVYLKARQESSGARVALFTGLTSTPSRSLDGTRITYTVECYSVLKSAADILVPRGYYAPTGSDAALLVASLLSVGPAPVVVDGESPGLSEAIVAEDNMSRLDVAWLILEAIGWRLRVTGEGVVHICERASDSSAVFDTRDNDVVELAMTDAQDWFSVPNCIRVLSGDRYAEYIDDDPGSAVSTVSRKATRGGSGQIWMSDNASSVGDGESLAEYAMRILKQNQEPARTISYSRRYRPDVLVGDRVTLHLSSVGIDGVFKITSQTVALGYGCRTSEEVVAV